MLHQLVPILLIVPYGIEMRLCTGALGIGSQLLIVPYGIEIRSRLYRRML